MKKNNGKWIKVSILVFSLLLLILFFTQIAIKQFQKDSFVIESRISNVEKNVVDSLDEYKTVGWIKIQGTNIDYPILYNSNWIYPGDMEKYAKMAYYEPGFHNHFDVSGHNIYNLSSTPIIHNKLFTRFEELMDFVYYDFAKENRYIQFTYEGKDYVYKIFMSGFVPLEYAENNRSFPDFDDEEMEEYFEILNNYNIYKYDVDISKNDKFLSLSTCTRFYGNNIDWKFVVTGRLLRKNEKMDSYSVKKTSKYKEIEKILKGDEFDEEV